MELGNIIKYSPFTIINTRQVLAGDSITFEKGGIQANGYVSYVNELGLYLTVKYYNVVANREETLQFAPTDFVAANFVLLKWASFGWDTIKSNINFLTTEVEVAALDKDALPPKYHIHYSLDGKTTYTAALVNAIDDENLCAIDEVGKKTIINISQIMSTNFHCRYSPDLLEIKEFYYVPLPEKIYYTTSGQRIMTQDGAYFRVQ